MEKNFTPKMIEMQNPVMLCSHTRTHTAYRFIFEPQNTYMVIDYFDDSKYEHLSASVFYKEYDVSPAMVLSSELYMWTTYYDERLIEYKCRRIKNPAEVDNIGIPYVNEDIQSYNLIDNVKKTPYRVKVEDGKAYLFNKDNPEAGKFDFRPGDMICIECMSGEALIYTIDEFNYIFHINPPTEKLKEIVHEYNSIAG